MRSLVLGAALCAIVVGLSGCASAQTPDPATSGSAEPSASPSASPSSTLKPSPSVVAPSASPSPTPSASAPTAQPDAPAVTCLTLLDKTTQERLVSEAESGLAIIDGWSEKLHREGSVLARFEDLGGVSCAIGFVGTDNVVNYDWSPITEASKAEIRPVLAGQGMVTVSDPRGELWCIPAEMADAGRESCFLFRANDWFFADDKPLLATYIAAVDGR